MKRALAFVKATFLGGVVVVLPAWLAVLLVLKALGHLEIFVKPVSSHLPQTLGHPRVIAILVLVGLCFLVGAAIQTAIGQKAERAAERAVLDKIPGYTVLRSLASRLSDHAETASFQPALVEMEEALAPAFVVERYSGDRCTIFIPSVSTPMAGSVYIIDNSRVHPLDLPAVSVMQRISKWAAEAASWWPLTMRRPFVPLRWRRQQTIDKQQMKASERAAYENNEVAQPV